MNPSPDKISVRNANDDDLPQLCELLALLFEQEADFKPDAERQARGIQLILKQPEVGQIICAVQGTRVIGMVSILFTLSTAEGGRAAWLEDMIVRPDQRGMGVGENLLKTAIERSNAAGCCRITLLTDATNHSAMRFYERSGFTRSQMTPFRLPLPENQ